MKQVGVDYTKASATAIRRLAFFISPLAVIYIILATYGLLPGSELLTPLAALVFSALWLVAVLYYYFFPSESKAQRHARVIMYHALGLITIVGILGFANPLTVLYALLFLASHMYFGRRGFALSALAFLAAGATDTLIRVSLGQDVLIQNIISFVAVTLLSAAIISFMSTQETKRRALLHSRKQAQLQQERLVTIINNLSDATFSVSQSGIVSMYNAACLSLLDINTNIKGKRLAEILNLFDEDDNPVAVADLLSGAERTEKRDDLSHKYSDGESIRLEVTYAPIRSSYSASRRTEAQGGFIVIMRDITKQKSLEEERDEFISVVSHELRTPITIAEGTISNLNVLMERGLDKVDPAMLEKTVSTAHEQILYLARMVNDLSTLSRAERGVAADVERIDVKELLEMLFHKYEPEALAHGLQLNLDVGAKLGAVKVSKLYLEELLQNFITNAIKYTHEGSVTVSGERKGDSVLFSVKDTGIGMSRTDQVNIFKKFYRSEDFRIRETSGTGLGLYVSAKLANMIGAKIDLKSRVNFGSTFSFELPVDTEEKQ